VVKVRLFATAVFTAQAIGEYEARRDRKGAEYFSADEDQNGKNN
jgi:hypothetical protein